MKHLILSNRLIDFLNKCVNFGQTCIFCTEHAPTRICPPCRCALQRPPRDICPRCGAPSPGALPCARCRQHPPPFSRLSTGWALAFPLDALLFRCKYAHDLSCIAALAELVSDGLSGHVATVDAVIPVPLHPARQSQRGFNQSLEIIRPFARLQRIPVLDRQLLRIRDTTTQAGLTLAARRRNPRRAFACNERLDGRVIAVFDDVVTSGATLSAAAAALLQAGAARVDGWALARTPSPGDAAPAPAYHQIEAHGENPFAPPPSHGMQ